MRLDLRYLGRSGVSAASWGLAFRFAPNLARPKVFFDAELRHPIRFREAMGALHDVVVGDLRFKKRDKTAYRSWKEQQDRQESAVRTGLVHDFKAQELARLATEEAPPPDLDKRFRAMHLLYWNARRKWANELSRLDPELFRHLVPCDPVVTVAPDVVFFECFSKDESSYGCLVVERDAFGPDDGAGLGTTNVDYSLALYQHFQTLRTYRKTRLTVDPSGFEVKAEGLADYREEKIDLPPSWLRGFGQISATMGLPSRTITLPPETVYSVLAFLKRHREKAGPRSIRFRLTPGLPPSLILEPWGVEIVSSGPIHEGDRTEEIKCWGRRRLLVLARLLPLVTRFEVRLFGSGLPSIWTAHLGEMRFVLALSGWTTNDWTSGANIDLLAGAYRHDQRTRDELDRYLEKTRQASLPVLEKAFGAPRDVLLGSLHRLAKEGQLVHDFSSAVYRYRPVMPVALSEAALGPESPELVAALELFRGNDVRITLREPLAGGRHLFGATVDGTACEAILDADGVLSRGKCVCSHYRRFGLRAGPCRHLLSLRFTARREPLP